MTLNLHLTSTNFTTTQFPSFSSVSSSSFLVETLHHGILIAGDVAGSSALAEAEDALDDAQLGRRGIETRHGHPVIDDHSGAHHVAAAVHTAGDKWHLQQAAELVLVLYAGLGVHEAALVAERHVRAYQHVVGNSLTEHLDAQHVGYDLLRLALQVRVNQGDVVVADYHVPEGRQALLDALDPDLIGQ